MRLCTDLFVDVEHFAISTNDKRPAEGYGAFVCNDSVSSCCLLFIEVYWCCLKTKLMIFTVIVKLIVSVGKSAIAIGIPRNDVLPIKPASWDE